VLTYHHRHTSESWYPVRKPVRSTFMAVVG